MEPRMPFTEVGWMQRIRKIACGLFLCVLILALSGCAKKKEKVIYTVGQEVQMGSYEGSSIEWIVLDVRDNGDALLITKYVLEMKPYHDEKTNADWEHCTLRTWLNGSFFDSAFTKEEKKAILSSKIENPDNLEFSISGGNATEDRIFLLSFDEANQYFQKSKDRRCLPTDLAVEHGVMTSLKGSSKGCAPWWLRSPGRDPHSAACVRDFGYVLSSGYNVYYEGYGVRPAMWVEA